MPEASRDRSSGTLAQKYASSILDTSTCNSPDWRRFSGVVAIAEDCLRGNHRSLRFRSCGIYSKARWESSERVEPVFTMDEGGEKFRPMESNRIGTALLDSDFSHPSGDESPGLYQSN